MAASPREAHSGGRQELRATLIAASPRVRVHDPLAVTQYLGSQPPRLPSQPQPGTVQRRSVTVAGRAWHSAERLEAHALPCPCQLLLEVQGSPGAGVRPVSLKNPLTAKPVPATAPRGGRSQ